MSIVLYGPGPVPENPRSPWTTPQPTIEPKPYQAIPPFDLMKVGAEDLGVIKTRIAARIKVIEDQLSAIAPLQKELEALRAMLAAVTSDSPGPAKEGASDK